MSNTVVVLCETGTAYHSRAPELTPCLLVGYFLVFRVVLSCVFTFLVSCCDVRYELRLKSMFGSSLPPVVRRRARVSFMLFVFVAYGDVQHALTT
jgi:hypothetical protein